MKGCNPKVEKLDLFLFPTGFNIEYGIGGKIHGN